MYKLYLIPAGFTPKGAVTPAGSVAGVTPGRSVRDKLNINREDAFADEAESEFSMRQQQVRVNVNGFLFLN